MSLDAGSYLEPENRMYRATCPHASWWVLVDQAHAHHELLPVQCPGGCGLVWARSMEPPP